MKAAKAWIPALIFPLVRAARANPLRAQIVLRVLTTESRYKKIKIKSIGKRTGSSVNVRKTEMREMLSAIGSSTLPRSVTWLNLRAK